LGRLVPLAFDLDEEDAEGEGRYPTYELGNYTNSLPLPIPISLTPNTNTTSTNTTNTPILKPPLPPLPPRPGPSPLVYSHTNPNPNASPDRSAGAGGGGAGTGVGAGASRLTSGFASLFGARSSTPPLVRTPPALPPLPPTATAGAAGVTGVDGVLDGDVGLRTPPSSITPTSISTSTSPQTPPSSTTSPFPSPATPPLPPLSTPPPSQTQTQTIEIQAYTIPHAIIRDEVGEKVRLGIEKEVCDALDSFTFTFAGGKEGGGGWVAESVMEFVKDLMPFVKVESKGTGTGAGTNKNTGMTMGMTLVAGKGATATRRSSERDSIAAGGGGGTGTGTKYVIPAFNERIEDLSERFQAFYERLEGDLYAFFSGGGGGDAKSSLGLGGDRDGKARNESEEDRERSVKEVMELVEKIICELFYDRYVPFIPIIHLLYLTSFLFYSRATYLRRLYLQPTSDDATHDEALSSRVAALNMLDLGLEHLDVDVSHVGGEGVDVVVKACGESE
jgi:hypothetical protein